MPRLGHSSIRCSNPRRPLVLPLLLLAGLLLPAVAVGQCTPGWDATLGVPGANGTVHSFAVYGGELYVGGEFTTIGGVAAPGLARFDGTTWTAVGSGVLDGGTVRALVVANLGSGPRLYIGGDFFGIGGNFIALVTEFDGTNFSTLNGGCEGSTVTDLALFETGAGTRIFACGVFGTAGGVFAEGVASWDGTNWFGFGNGSVNGTVRTFGVHAFPGEAAPFLYLGGSFSSVGGTIGNNILRYDGLVASDLGLGVDGAVDAIASFNDLLYVAGSFSNAGGLTSPAFSQWDGFGWSNPAGMSIPVPGEVSALEPTTVDGAARLAIGGSFAEFGGAPSPGLVLFDGGPYSTAGSGTDLPVRVLLDVPAQVGAIAGGLYVGGEFLAAGGNSADRVARFDTCAPVPSVTFRRADANGDGTLNIADAVSILGILFGSGTPVPCEETLDVNDDGSTNIADAVTLLNSLFVPGSPDVPSPVDVCGPDTDGDAVPCAVSTPGC